jgi:putative ABC transport system permease protein
MLLNNIKYTLRSIKKDKSYTFLNIFGLAAGLTVTSLVLLFVLHELSFDSYQNNSDRIYVTYYNVTGTENYSANTPFILSQALKDNLTGIEEIAQVSQIFWSSVNLFQDRNFIELDNCYFADPAIFNILSFDFLRGSAQTFSVNKYSVLLSENYAIKYFPNNKSIIGNSITIHMGSYKYELEIAGIFKDAPFYTHFRPDIIFPMALFKTQEPEAVLSWSYNNPITYLLLEESISKKTFENNLTAYIKTKSEQKGLRYHLLPLSDLHLYSTHISGLFGKRGNINMIYIFTSIAFLTLLVSCINFINISTVRSSLRAREIGIRKVIGASKFSLIKKLLFESLFITFISFIISLATLELLMTFAEQLFDRSFNQNLFKNWEFLIFLIIISVLSAILSGIYSAVISANQNPLEVIKSQARISSSNSFFRKSLISFQFLIFSALIISSFIINSQIQFVRNIDLGYNKEQILVISIPSSDYINNSKIFKNELLKYPQVKHVALSSTVPPSFGNQLAISFRADGAAEPIKLRVIYCDESFMDVLGLNLESGRFFNTYDSDSSNPKAVLNIKAKDDLNFGIPGGNFEKMLGNRIEIIGVIDNFFSKGNRYKKSDGCYRFKHIFAADKRNIFYFYCQFCNCIPYNLLFYWVKLSQPELNIVYLQTKIFNIFGRL